MTKQILNISGYQFLEIVDTESVRKQVQKLCDQTHLRGTIFISPEGINLSIAGTQADLEFVIERLKSIHGFTQMILNTTYSDEIPFKRLLVKARKELVPTRLTNEKTIKYIKSTANAAYIDSDVLKKWLDDGKEFTLLDLRNTFEYELGSFDNAKHLSLKYFRELESSYKILSTIPKDRPVVTYCTGGIRCEKGAPHIAQQGFEQVYQLKGGILDYLAKYKDNHWHGDCFVFDERVSLDHELKPSYARLCRSCQTILQESDDKFCETCTSLS